LRVLDPTIVLVPVSNGYTFGDIEGSELRLPDNRWPFRRLLNHHARCAYQTAKENEWIDKNLYVEHYFQLSDVASMPSDDEDLIEEVLIMAPDYLKPGIGETTANVSVKDKDKLMKTYTNLAWNLQQNERAANEQIRKLSKAPFLKGDLVNVHDRYKTYRGTVMLVDTERKMCKVRFSNYPDTWYTWDSISHLKP